MDKEHLIQHLKNYKFSEKIIGAFKKVKREDFIPQDLKKFAYEDTPLPIGHNQTISQPYTIAFMLNLLEIENKQKILEVGSGSGYVLALMSELNLNGKIIGIERIKQLAENSSKALKNYKNVKVIYGQGEKGLEKEKPFDRILVSASSSSIPKKLLEQLKINGILVMPLRDSIIQLKKLKNKEQIKEFPGFVFVPLIEE